MNDLSTDFTLAFKIIDSSINVLQIIIYPTLIFVLILIIKNPIFKLLREIEIFKFKDIELKFIKNMEKASEDAEHVFAESKDEAIKNQSISDNMLKLIQVSPRSAIVESWRKVEYKLVEIFNIKKDTLNYIHLKDYKLLTEKPTINYISKALHRNKFIDDDFFQILLNLNKLRNESVHSVKIDISADVSTEYVIMASKTLLYLEKVVTQIKK